MVSRPYHNHRARPGLPLGSEGTKRPTRDSEACSVILCLGGEKGLGSRVRSLRVRGFLLGREIGVRDPVVPAELVLIQKYPDVAHA
jgi:hypothetical protein